MLSEIKSEDHSGSMKTSDTSTDGGNEQHGDADHEFPHPPSSEGDKSNDEEVYDDYDAPEESWHPNSTGPISRDEFHRYQSLVEEQIHRLRLERDEFRALWNKERARADSGIKRYRETQRMIERESKMDHEKWERSLRESMNEPVWPPRDEVPRSNFLYNNIEDVMAQHCITTTLLHAQACLNAKNPDQAEELVWEALELARTFNYEPLEGRCKYWLGRIELVRGDDKRARMFFMKARSCIGKYKEGDDVEMYLSLFQPGLSDLEKKRIILRHTEAVFSRMMETQRRPRKGNKQCLKTENHDLDVVSGTNHPATEYENEEDSDVDRNSSIQQAAKKKAGIPTSQTYQPTILCNTILEI